MKNEEDWYDAEIAPKLREIAKACVDRGVPFVAGVQYADEDIGVTAWVPHEALDAMQRARVTLRMEDRRSLTAITVKSADGKIISSEIIAGEARP